MLKNKIKNQEGTTLIEIVVGIAIIGIVAISMYMALFNVTKLMGNAKQKIGAVALANEQMEIIRNLEYDQVGTQGWVPSGPIVQTQTVSRNDFTYSIDTTIEYVDDSFDGVGVADSVETDYKQAQITVSWTLGGDTREVIFISKFIPEGLETNIGGGTLSVNIIDAAVQPIEGVMVKIDSVTDTPAIHGSANTAADGNMRLPGLPQQEYRITVTKGDYATVQTYPAPPSSSFNPVNSNLFVADGGVVIKTLTMNKSADLLLKAKNIADDDGIDNINIEISGGPVIGTTPETLTIEEDKTTDSSGEVDLDDINPGDYNIVNLATLGDATYEYIGVDNVFPLHLNSDDDKEVNFIFAKKNVDSLLIVVKNNVTNELIEGAQVKVSNSSGFEQTINTSVDGRVYFPAKEDPPVVMSAEEYDIEVNATGFTDFSGTKDISNLVKYDVLMIP